MSHRQGRERKKKNGLLSEGVALRCLDCHCIEWVCSEWVRRAPPAIGATPFIVEGQHLSLEHACLGQMCLPITCNVMGICDALPIMHNRCFLHETSLFKRRGKIKSTSWSSRVMSAIWTANARDLSAKNWEGKVWLQMVDFSDLFQGVNGQV